MYFTPGSGYFCLICSVIDNLLPYRYKIEWNHHKLFTPVLRHQLIAVFYLINGFLFSDVHERMNAHHDAHLPKKETHLLYFVLVIHICKRIYFYFRDALQFFAMFNHINGFVGL